MQLKTLFDLRLRCQARQNPFMFYVYVTDNVEIAPRIHSGKNAAVDEDLNENGKELL